MQTALAAALKESDGKGRRGAGAARPSAGGAGAALGAAVAIGIALFERGCEKGTLVKVLDLASVTVPLCQVSEPMLLRGFDATEMLATDGVVIPTLAAFKQKFISDDLYKVGRADRPLKKSIQAIVYQTFDKIIFPNGRLPNAKMHAESLPANFGIRKGQESVAVERGRAPTLRVHIEGQRQLIMVHTEQLKNFMVKNSITALAPDALQNFLRAMTKYVIDSYLNAGNSMWHTIVGPNEGLLLPFNILFAERTLKEDVFGVRMSCWRKSDTQQMDECNTWLVSVRRPNIFLQSAVEALAEIDAD